MLSFEPVRVAYPGDDPIAQIDVDGTATDSGTVLGTRTLRGGPGARIRPTWAACTRGLGTRASRHRAVHPTVRLGSQLDPDLVTQWLFWEANRIGFSVPNLRAVLTYAKDTSLQGADWLRARAIADLARLDLELDSNPYLLGSDATVVDIACCAHLFWPEQAGLDLLQWPNVTDWLGRIRRLPGWAEPYDLLS